MGNTHKRGKKTTKQDPVYPEDQVTICESFDHPHCSYQIRLERHTMYVDKDGDVLNGFRAGEEQLLRAVIKRFAPNSNLSIATSGKYMAWSNAKLFTPILGKDTIYIYFE
jgi:hypothetical protein